jgi:hypothetical protein
MCCSFVKVERPRLNTYIVSRLKHVPTRPALAWRPQRAPLCARSTVRTYSDVASAVANGRTERNRVHTHVEHSSDLSATSELPYPQYEPFATQVWYHLVATRSSGEKVRTLLSGLFLGARLRAGIARVYRVVEP